MIHKALRAFKLIENGAALGEAQGRAACGFTKLGLDLATLRQKREIQFWKDFHYSALVNTQENKKWALRSLFTGKKYNFLPILLWAERKERDLSPSGDQRCGRAPNKPPKSQHNASCQIDEAPLKATTLQLFPETEDFTPKDPSCRLLGGFLLF